MEIWTIAFSTFLGAVVALAADRLGRMYDSRLKEESAINNLILDLAGKRAFLTSDSWVWADGEIDRVVKSVIEARAIIREARIASRPRSKTLPHIRLMARACSSFLESSERLDPKHLQPALKELSAKLTTQVLELHKLDPRRILSDTPGSFSLD